MWTLNHQTEMTCHLDHKHDRCLCEVSEARAKHINPSYNVKISQNKQATLNLPTQTLAVMIKSVCFIVVKYPLMLSKANLNTEQTESLFMQITGYYSRM